MAYVPIESTAAGTAATLPHLALLTDAEKNTTLLGVQSYVAFLLGEWRGEIAEARTLEQFSGPIISGLEIEIDHASAFNHNQSSTIPALSLVRRDTSLFLFGLERTRGPFGHQKTMGLITDALPACERPISAAWSQWRLVLPVGNKKVEVLAIDANAAP